MIQEKCERQSINCHSQSIQVFIQHALDVVTIVEFDNFWSKLTIMAPIGLRW